MPRIVLYTIATCAFCMATKNFLKARNLSWRELRVDTDPQAREAMVAATHRTSVPQIVINDVPIGGFDDMMAMNRSGALRSLLSEVP
nr:glutaredoxin domain-containing protein [Pseudoxanthomonas sp.]